MTSRRVRGGPEKELGKGAGYYKVYRAAIQAAQHDAHQPGAGGQRHSRAELTPEELSQHAELQRRIVKILRG